MPETLSKFDEFKQRNLRHCSDVIDSELEKAGVPEGRRLAFIEQGVTFVFMPDGEVVPHFLESGLAVAAEYGYQGDRIVATGSSDEHLRFFARNLHLLHPEIGGNPAGAGKPPVPDYVRAEKERLELVRQKREERAQRELEQKQEFEQRKAEKRLEQARLDNAERENHWRGIL